MKRRTIGKLMSKLKKTGPAVQLRPWPRDPAELITDGIDPYNQPAIVLKESDLDAIKAHLKTAFEGVQYLEPLNATEKRIRGSVQDAIKSTGKILAGAIPL